MAYGHDGRCPFLLNLSIECFVPFGVDARFAPHLKVHIGPVVAKPVGHLLHQDIAIIEAAVDQIDRFATQVGWPRRQTLTTRRAN